MTLIFTIEWGDGGRLHISSVLLIILAAVLIYKSLKRVRKKD